MRFDNITAKGCYPPDCTSTTSTTSTSSTSSTSTSTASTTTCGSVALGTVSPDITSASPSSFGVFPPGNYEVLYLYGALQYNNALTPPVFQINDWNNGHGYQIVFSGGLSQIQGPGLSTGYSSQEDVEDANTGQSVQFYHAGGIIGMFLFDNPYSDNVSGLTANPTFRAVLNLRSANAIHQYHHPKYDHVNNDDPHDDEYQYHVNNIDRHQHFDYDRSMKISAIIPIYRPGIEILGRCVSCVHGQVDEIIIAMEGNSILPHGLARGDNIRVVQLSRSQIGFGANVNHGAALATGDVLLILNSDAYLDPGAVAYMLDCLTGQVAMVCHYLRNLDGSDSYRGSMRTIDGYTQPSKLPAAPHDVEVAYGASFIIRRDVFCLLVSFDEKFMLDFDDTDLSLRVRQCGFRIMFTPFAKGTHQMGGDKPNNPDREKMTRAGVCRNGKWDWYHEDNKLNSMGSFGRCGALNYVLPPLPRSTSDSERGKTVP